MTPNPFIAFLSNSMDFNQPGKFYCRVMTLVFGCSSYDEDVVLMLVRLETLFHLENNDAFPKIGRLCSKIIHKLTTIASKVSKIDLSLLEKPMEIPYSCCACTCIC